MPEPELILTDEYLVSESDLKALATAAAAERPRQQAPSPPPGPQPVAPVFPPPKVAAYVHREVRIVTTPTGGYGVVVADALVGVAEGAGRLQTLIADWVKGL